MSHLASEATSELEKRTAAATAAALVESGMTLGLGTGSTVAYLLPILALRRLRLRCVATSVATDVLLAAPVFVSSPSTPSTSSTSRSTARIRSTVPAGS